MSESEIKEIQWTIHQSHPDRVKSVRDRLSEVIDPEIGMNIIQLGLDDVHPNFRVDDL